jgi:hypothetical protein
MTITYRAATPADAPAVAALHTESWRFAYRGATPPAASSKTAPALTRSQPSDLMRPTRTKAQVKGPQAHTGGSGGVPPTSLFLFKGGAGATTRTKAQVKGPQAHTEGSGGVPRTSLFFFKGWGGGHPQPLNFHT